MNSEEKFVAVDVETTGLSPHKEYLIEIAAVKYRGEKEEKSFQTLIKCKKKLPLEIVELTKITDEMLEKEGIEEKKAIRDFLDFIEDFPLVGHNLLFDYSFLKYACSREKLTFERKGVDTLKLARKLLPELKSRSLEVLCHYFKIDNGQAHRALSDAKSAAKLYLLLQKRLTEKEKIPFEPLQFSIKKIGPATTAQKNYLNDLIKYHKISCNLSVNQMTKSEASRTIDNIIFQYGKILR